MRGTVRDRATGQARSIAARRRAPSGARLAVDHGVAPSDSYANAVYAVLRVRDAAGEVDLHVGDRRYAATFLYQPKAVAVRDRLYLRLVDDLAVDVVGAVVATDVHGTGPRKLTRGARFTVRVTTVQRSGVDIATDALVTGRFDDKPLARGRLPSAYASSRMALPSLDGEPVPVPRASSPLQGTLDARTMHDLVAHHLRQATKVAIEVTGEHGLGGSVFVEGGEVVAAWAGNVRGIEGLLRLATYVGASFRVRPGCTTVMRNVEQPPQLILRALANVQPPAPSPFTDEPTLVDVHGSDASYP